MQERLASVAADLGLPLNPRSRTFNSRRAQEVGKYAEKMGRMEAYGQSVYEAYFVEGRNIALIEELLAVAQRAGLDGKDVAAVIEQGIYAKAVDDDWRRARLLGISGVPAFVCGQKLMVGFRPYQDFETLIGSG